MNERIRKYRIKQLLDSLPYSERRDAIETLCEQMQIYTSMLRKIWGYRIGDVNEAKVSQLQIIAEFFNTTIDDLINDDPAEEAKKKETIDNTSLSVEG